LFVRKTVSENTISKTLPHKYAFFKKIIFHKETTLDTLSGDIKNFTFQDELFKLFDTLFPIC